MAPIIAVTVSFFVCVALIVWTVGSIVRRSKLIKAQTDLQMKLLERFGSSEELLAFLKSNAGRDFLHTALSEPRRSPKSSIMGSIAAGTVLTFLGSGFAYLYSLPRGMSTHGEFSLLMSGVICLALGLGFLVSALLSYFFTKSWERSERAVKEGP